MNGQHSHYTGHDDVDCISRLFQEMSVADKEFSDKASVLRTKAFCRDWMEVRKVEKDLTRIVKERLPKESFLRLVWCSKVPLWVEGENFDRLFRAAYGCNGSAQSVPEHDYFD